MSAAFILDSWAVLAWIRNEPAASRIDEILRQAEHHQIPYPFLSWINAGEVYYMLVRKHSAAAAEEFLSRLDSLPLRLVVPDPEMIVLAARLKSSSRISYADGFAAALALVEHATLVTGDPELRQMANRVTIEWVGETPPPAPQ